MEALAPTFHLPQDRQNPEQIQATRGTDPGGVEELGGAPDDPLHGYEFPDHRAGRGPGMAPQTPQLEVEALGRPTQLHFMGLSTPRSAEAHPEVFAGF